MNFSADKLYTLLETEDAQDIADSFAKALNEAIKMKAKKDQEAQKKKDAEQILNLCNDYVKKYYPEVADYISDLNVDAYLESIDTLCNELSPFISATGTKKPETKKERTRDNDALGEFLRANGLA
jgi:hypothetical protein